MTSVFYLKGLDCPDCAKKLKKSIKDLSNIEKVDIVFSIGKLEVKYDDIVQDDILREVMELIQKQGYKIERVVKNGIEEKENAIKKGESVTDKTSNIFSKVFGGGVISAAISGTVLLLASLIWFAGYPKQFVILTYSIAIVVGGFATFKKGINSLFKLKFDIDVLMVIALIGAVLIGEWMEGAIIAFLFSLSHALESYAMEKTRRSIKKLMDLSLDVTMIKTEEGEREVPVYDVKVGDVVIVRPGDRIPIDGKVLVGSSWVNESAVTGESQLIAKYKGLQVYAGSINEGGYLEILAEKLASESTISKIIKLVEKALEEKPPIQRTVDKFTAYYTPIILLIALGTVTIPTLIFGYDFVTWIYRSLALLLIACPCALIISTPVALVSAMGKSAKVGVLVKGGAYFEKMAKVKILAFDKTGTLTKGEPRVCNVHAADGVNEDQIIKIAYSLELKSEHPLAKSLRSYSESKNIKPLKLTFFKSYPGMGVEGKVLVDNEEIECWLGNMKFLESKGAIMSEELRWLFDENKNLGKTVIGIAVRSVSQHVKFLGAIVFEDDMRKEAREVIEDVKGMGAITIMLTGDNKSTAQYVASSIGIDLVYAELMPEEKLRLIEKMQKKGMVSMVGDGINDAPALAKCDVGIAMGSKGTDIALDVADVTLLNDDISKIPFFMRLSKKSLNIIKQNIALTIFLKLIAVGLISGGFLTLWMAVLADMGTTLIVIMNSLRLSIVRKKIFSFKFV